MVSKIFRFIIKTLTGILLLAMLVMLPYTITPVYQYPEPTQFKGEKIYNPYKNKDFSEWQRINFHAHSNHWGNIGITDANSNTPENIYKMYREELGYTLPGISDYQHINRSLDSLQSFIPVYEHGYNINRVHQLPANAKKVTFLDYILWQTVHNKQHVINTLRKQSNLVILAHPKLDNGYKPRDFQRLTNFQGIEILNTYVHNKPAMDYWDIALSSGKYIVAAGDDDLHNLSREKEYGYRFNSVVTKHKEADSLIANIQRGSHIVVDLPRASKHDLAWKKKKLRRLEKRIKTFTVSGDTVTLEVVPAIKHITFIGQDGKVLKKTEKDKMLTYVLQPDDTYLRAEVKFLDDIRFFFNPVVRYTSDISEYQQNATIQVLPTVIFSLLRIAIWIALFSFVFIKVMIRWKGRKE